MQSVMSAEREELGDYQLYRLPWATDLNARQTKQAVFLVKSRVKIERFYSAVFSAQDAAGEESFTPGSMIAFENRKVSGLGEPLPAGVMRMFENTRTGEVFAGEARMSDKPVDAPVELAVAKALDLGIELDVVRASPEELRDRNFAGAFDVELRAFNAKGVPVTLEIRQHVDAYMPGVTIPASNHRFGRKYGDFAWRLRVPANGTRLLTYRIEMPEAPDDQ